jgi:hypothetical protein
MIMRWRFAAIIAILATIASPAFAEAAQYGPKLYDGAWSVVIQTTRGNCPASLRAAVRISRGRLAADDESYQLNGRVAANGKVRVTVAAGGKGAGGFGHLRRDSGNGSWRILSGECGGQWTAQRRG